MPTAPVVNTTLGYAEQRGALAARVDAFRYVGITTAHSLQTAFMTFAPGEATAPEVHSLTEQLFVVLPGSGAVKAVVDGVARRYAPNDVFVVLRHARHVVGATRGAAAPARLYTVYSEPRHAANVVQLRPQDPERAPQPPELASTQHEATWIAFDELYERATDAGEVAALAALSLRARAEEAGAAAGVHSAESARAVCEAVHRVALYIASVVSAPAARASLYAQIDVAIGAALAAVPVPMLRPGAPTLAIDRVMGGPTWRLAPWRRTRADEGPRAVSGGGGSR